MDEIILATDAEGGVPSPVVDKEFKNCLK